MELKNIYLQFVKEKIGMKFEIECKINVFFFVLEIPWICNSFAADLYVCFLFFKSKHAIVLLMK